MADSSQRKLLQSLQCWSDFINLKLESSGKRDPQLWNYLHLIDLWACLWASSLWISDRYGRAQPTVDVPLPAGNPEFYKKAEQTMESKAVNSAPSCSLLQFLPANFYPKFLT